MGPPEVALVKLFVGLAAALLLVVGADLQGRGKSGEFRRARSVALAVLGAAGALCWWNLFQFHYPGFQQGHELYHYYLGGKYFPELGYTRLYSCTAVADAEVIPRKHLRGLPLRDLASNRIVPILDAVDHPERCTAHFQPARWKEFRDDVGWFRSRMRAVDWHGLKVDHGFNAPPAWGVLGVSVANLLDVSSRSVIAASLIDSLLQLAMWSAVAWAFGWRILCVGLVFWGTNSLGEFSFVGGGYLRQDWLAAAVVGLCALRRNKHATAGALLATSALLRVFPLFLILALGTKTLASMWRARSWRPPAAHLRFAGGCLLAVAILVPLSGATSGGFDSWPRFAGNIRKHAEIPLLNYLGLRTLASYHPANPIPVDLGADTERWQRRRGEVLGDRSWLVAAGCLFYVLLLARAAGRAPDWVVAILGVGGVAVFLEITAYYYAVLIAYALLHERDPQAGPALCAFAVFSTLLAIHGGERGMDFVHVGTSLGLVALVLVSTWRAGRPLSGRGGDIGSAMSDGHGTAGQRAEAS
jgi:hypothetical protein